jgi:hypothetical protein
VRSTITAGLAILLLATFGGCEPRTQNAQRRIYCTVMADPPTWDSREHPKRIVGQVRYWCDKPGPARLSLTVRLQKRDAKGAWADVAKTAFVTSGTATTRTDDLRYRIRTVTAPCATGEFRTLVVGTSLARGITTPYDVSGETSNPCRTFLG